MQGKCKKNVLTKPSVENNQFTRKEVEKIDIMKQKEIIRGPKRRRRRRTLSFIYIDDITIKLL